MTLTGDKKTLTYNAFLDTGNNVDPGLASSERVHQAIWASFSKLGGDINSAGHAKLKVKGRSTPIKLQFKNKVYVVRPMVVKGLREPVNMGRRFMRDINTTLSYGKSNMMKSDEGEVPMIGAMEEPARKEPKGARQSRTKERSNRARMRSQKAISNPVTNKQL